MMHPHPSPLFHVVTIGPFAKWGVYFMTCDPILVKGDKYIIVIMDYFTKWGEAMPTFSNDSETLTLFIFNHVIARFRAPRKLLLTMALIFMIQ